MSPNDDNPEEVKKAKKKYLWFGYGSYSGYPEVSPLNPGNIRADPGIFETIFGLFGIKEKPKEDLEEGTKQ